MLDRATGEWTSHCLSIDFAKMPNEQRNRVRYAKFIEAGRYEVTLVLRAYDPAALDAAHTWFAAQLRAIGGEIIPA